MLNKNMRQSLEAFKSEGIVTEYEHGESDSHSHGATPNQVYTVKITWGVDKSDYNRSGFEDSLRKAGFRQTESFGQNRELWEKREERR